MSRRIEERMRGLTPPDSDLAQARVTNALRQASRQGRLRGGPGLKSWIAVGVGVVLLGLTPPGQALAEQLGELVGIGEDPTVEQVGSVPGSAAVLASGTLDDGTPYEVVASRVNAESFDPGPGSREGVPEMLCFQVDWPTQQARAGGGGCTRMHLSGVGNKLVLENAELFRPPERPQTGPALFLGIADDPTVARVEVLQVDRDGSKRPVPSELLTVEGELLQRVGGRYPVSAFLVVLDDGMVAAGENREAQITAIAFDTAGKELGRTDAFPPLDCPEDPSTLVPESDDSYTGPVSPVDQEALGRAVECGWDPPGAGAAPPPAP